MVQSQLAANPVPRTVRSREADWNHVHMQRKAMDAMTSQIDHLGLHHNASLRQHCRNESPHAYTCYFPTHHQRGGLHLFIPTDTPHAGCIQPLNLAIDCIKA